MRWEAQIYNGERNLQWAWKQQNSDSIRWRWREAWISPYAPMCRSRGRGSPRPPESVLQELLSCQCQRATLALGQSTMVNLVKQFQSNLIFSKLLALLRTLKKSLLRLEYQDKIDNSWDNIPWWKIAAWQGQCWHGVHCSCQSPPVTAGAGSHVSVTITLHLFLKLLRHLNQSWDISRDVLFFRNILDFSFLWFQKS